MQKSALKLARSYAAVSTRAFSTAAREERIVSSVLFERLPVVLPKVDPVVYAFQEFSFRWRRQYRPVSSDESLDKAASRAQADSPVDFEPTPRLTEADKTNDKKSLQRALDRKLYLLLFGESPTSLDGKPVWHFPEKVYEGEDSLRQCAESALKSVIGDLKNTYFVGNAPMGHTIILGSPSNKNSSTFKQFFNKAQVIASTEYDICKCDDYAWVTKDELLEYFSHRAEFLDKLILS